MSTSVEGRVIAVHRGQCDVELSPGAPWILCSLKGSLRELKKGAAQEELTPVAVGDQVLIEKLSDNQGVITQILPRKSELARPSVRRQHLKQVFCANIDQVAIVVSLRQPRFKSQVIDRLIVIALWGQVSPFLILSKVDLAQQEELDEICLKYKDLNVPIIQVSSLKNQGIDEVRNLCQNKLTAFCGQSGVGKSTLLNKLAGEEIVPTQAINQKTGKGRHTTSWTQIYSFPQGEIIDLPGNRQFGLWDEIPQNMISGFLPDIQKWGEECHFQPCTHIHEPQCRVQQALEEKELSSDRYRNYVRIFQSLNSD